MANRDFDAIVVGAGPNGLAAGIFLQQKGLRVLIVEAKQTVGGGLRSAELTLPGFKHDICSAIHPLAVASPFFKTLPLKEFGLNYIIPEIAAGHPFDDGKAAILHQSLEMTAAGLGQDKESYLKLIKPILDQWDNLLPELLGPLKFPASPVSFLRFGVQGLKSANLLAKNFSTREVRGLWAGMAAHSIQPLNHLTTSAIGLVLLSAAHRCSWPIPIGGSESIANALSSYFISLGGSIETNLYIKSLSQLPSSKAILFDVTPRQLLEIAGHKFSNLYKWQLERYRYGMGVFKMDWAIEGNVPFRAEALLKAGTIHLGNNFEEIASSESATSLGKHPAKPFVILAQQSVFDASRAPEGKQAVWAYCHVPHRSTENMSDAIEHQVERFAPGFKDRILAKHVFNTAQLEEYNSNYIGGDINGGILDLGQLFTRPALRTSPYRTSAKGLYLCSSSTPPGGGVHGMCGYHAALRAWKDLFIA